MGGGRSAARPAREGEDRRDPRRRPAGRAGRARGARPRHLLWRRGAGEVAGAGGGPPRARRAGRARRRGRLLLLAPRRLPHRHRARPVRQPAARRGEAGGEHAHPAARQERLPHLRAERLPQDPRGVHRGRRRGPAQQEEHPPGISQRDLPRRLRRHSVLRPRHRGAGLLREGRLRADPARGRHHRRHDQVARLLLTPGPSGPRPPAPRRRAPPHGRARLDRRRRSPERPGDARRDRPDAPGRPPRAALRRRHGQRGPRALRPAPARQPRLPALLDPRDEGPGARPPGGDRHPAQPRPPGAARRRAAGGGADLGRSPQRSHPGLRRRPEFRHQRVRPRLPGPPPGRELLQADRLHRRAGERQVLGGLHPEGRAAHPAGRRRQLDAEERRRRVPRRDHHPHRPGGEPQRAADPARHGRGARQGRGGRPPAGDRLRASIPSRRWLSAPPR